jgi:ferredoxin
VRPSVDRNLCIGCRLCEDACPEVFRIGDEGIAYVIGSDHDPECYEDIESCVELCPVAAIAVSAT